jgi:viroplasmin and RNaseH domain-containing protein
MKNLLKAFSIPESCMVEKNIPIGTFLANMDAPPKDKQDFKQMVNQLTIHAQINPEDVNLSSFISEEEHYQGILFLEVIVKSLKELTWLDEKIHATIPQPTIVFFKKDQSIRVSVPSKRINKVYRSKTVVESYWLTAITDEKELIEFTMEWFNENQAYQNNLKFLYLYMQNIMKVYQYRQLIGKSKEKLNILANLCSQIRELELKEQNLKVEYEHANMKKEKIIYHKELVAIQLQKSNVISKLKGE